MEEMIYLRQVYKQVKKCSNVFTLLSNSSSQKVDTNISAWLIDVSYLDCRFSTALCSALYVPGTGMETWVYKIEVHSIHISCNKL